MHVPSPKAEGGAAARPLPRAGDTVAEKYRVRSMLGNGGMGVVMQAEHLILGNAVALKFMHPHLVENEVAAARFAREARSAALLKSEHAVRILDVDRLDGGAPYIVMEYLEGESLDAKIMRDGPLPARIAASCVIQACAAIGEAHERGIIHRDIKPQNLFLLRTDDGTTQIKVLDFGLAKAKDLAGVAGTRTTGGLGSPHYMSPEQIIAASEVDARSDIWSIGATLYELIAGKPPFAATDVRSLFAAILDGAPRPLRERAPGVPIELEAVIARCLTREPSARFQNARELSRALQACVYEEPLVAPPLDLALPIPTAEPPSVRRRYVLAALTGPALLAIAALATMGWVLADESTAATKREPTAHVREPMRSLVTASGPALRPRTSRAPASRPR